MLVGSIVAVSVLVVALALLGSIPMLAALPAVLVVFAVLIGWLARRSAPLEKAATREEHR